MGHSFSTLRVLGLLLLFCVPGMPASAAEEEFPGIKRLMSDEDFRATGMRKLSESELKALDAWLLRYTAGEAEVLQQSSKAVREAEKDIAIESTIVGDFTGWSGNTLFQLENGQRWRQRLNGRYRYKGPPNPAVRIDKNWLGYFRLTLVESGRSIGVSPES